MNNIRRGIEKQLALFEELLAEGGNNLDVRVPSVSGWTPAEHLDHLLKVCSTTFQLVDRNEEVEGKGVSTVGRVVLLLGLIPRGRARSPSAVAGQKAEREELARRLSDLHTLAAKMFLNESALSSPKRVFVHPIFRSLTAAQALRFCEVHNSHHLRIIRDVMQASRSQ
ncbi:MAG: DinB family protein [Bdellovibrionota bacterium]